MFVRLRRDERGVALVVSLLVVMVVLILATAVVAQSIHNSTASAYDRKRLQSVDAAEAGINYFFNYLENSGATSLTSTFDVKAVAGAPGTATFELTPTWYGCQGLAATQACSPPFTDAYYPSSVKIVSSGIANGKTTRKMESYIAINPTFGGFEGAVLSGSSTSLVNSFTISGNNANDGDVTVNCDPGVVCNLNISSGNQQIKGNLYVPNGSATIGASVHVYGDVWANGFVTVNHPQALVDGSAISSQSSVTLSSGTVSGKGTYCTSVAGTFGSGTLKVCQPPPPAQTFPHLTFDDTAAPQVDAKWRTGCNSNPVTNCYQLRQFTDASGVSACTQARNFIEGSSAGSFNGGSGVPDPYTGVVVRILSTCTYNPSNNVTVNVGKDLAIISNGPINFGQQSTWLGVGGSHKMHLIVPWPQTCVSGNPGITVGNNTNFDSNMSVGLYTPCMATMSNQNAFYGQVIGGNVVIGNNWQMIFRPIVIPGAHVSSFTEDVAYIREVT